MVQSGRSFFIFFCILLNVHLASAQFFFQRYDSIQVKINSFYVPNPWAGGLNFVQVSDIDMDMDGKKDLFVFDRTGNKIRTFINKGTAGSVDYKYDHKYESKFPQLSEWALLADYNCDGKEDIFCYSSWGGGFDVYKNISSSTELLFLKVATQVRSKYNPPGSGTYNLYVMNVDIPAITDIDNDGDLDVVTFGNASNTMEYHQNQSMELYGTCDSLKFQVKNRCWGYAEESGLTNDYTLNISCSNVPNPGITTPDNNNDSVIGLDSRSAERHSGGCELCIDLDADGDKELIVGDVSYGNLTMLTNGGTPTSGIFTAVDQTFPSNNTSTSAVNLSIFPCGYYEDVNYDGIRDLLISPNAANVSENFNSLVYYKNAGTDDAPVFQFQQSNLLQDNMIDVGEGAYPVFFDYDNDGLKDLFVGNYGYFKLPSDHETKIAQFKNIGTASVPKFELITRDYNGYSSLGISNLVPAFGDMDADGDADMILGGADGRLQYFENTGGTGTASFTATPTQVNFKNSNNRIIDIGDFAAPQIVDVDGDGKKDLVIGARNGKIAYYQHIGSATAAVPTMDSITHFFGNIKVNEPGYVTGYTHPFVFKQGGVTKLLTGTETGYLYLYDNIDGNLTGAFTRVDSTFMNVWEGAHTAPNLADINNDGYLDMAVGNYQGGVIFLKGVSALSVNNPDNIIQWDVDLFPNPANHSITIHIRNEKNSTYQLELYNVMGQLISTQKITGTITLDTEQLSQGIYVCKVSELSTSGEINTGTLIKRIVIQH